jgi:hypothetical protein
VVRAAAVTVLAILLAAACAAPADGPAAAPGTADRTNAAPDSTGDRDTEQQAAVRADGGIDPVGGADTTDKVTDGFPSLEGPTAYLTDVRTAGQDGFDRIVLEFTGDEVPSYRIGYVDPPVREDGSGHVVPVEGHAALEIRLTPAAGVNLTGEQPRQTYIGPNRVSPPFGAVVNEVVRTGDFEANLAWTAGLTHRAPFAVAVFSDPLRLVVDVLHRHPDDEDLVVPIGEAGTAADGADGAGPPAVVTDVRVGRHEGFDRIVFEIGGDGQVGWDLRYTEQARSQGSGMPVEVPGDAVLAVTLTNVALPADAPAATQPWDGPERTPAPPDANALVGLVEDTVFEGHHTFFAGLTGQRPFAVDRLSSPQRIVIDILGA